MTTTATLTYVPVVITSFPPNPLTTTFTPPADCSGFYASSVYMVDPSLSCLPSGASTQATDYFSPGIACPSGYYSACHDTNGVSSITTVTCCHFQGDVTLSCVDPATLAGFFATLFCTWIAPSTTTLPVTLSANFGTTSTSELEFVSPGGVNAFGVRVVYESTDLIISSAATVTIPPTSVPVSTLLPAVPTSPPAVSTSPASTGSTSTGTIVIAVVILVVALAVLGAVYMWWRKRRRQREPQGITSEVYAGPKGELAGSPTKFLNYAHATPAELPIDGSG